MNPLLELAKKIEPDVARDPDRTPEPQAPPVIGQPLRAAILSAIKSSSAYEERWARDTLEDRRAVLTLVLRRKPRLMLKALEAAEFHDAVVNVAKEVIAALGQTSETDIAEMLREHGVQDPSQVDQVTRRLYEDPDLLSEVTRVINPAVPFPIVLALELEEIRKSRRERDPEDELRRTPDEGPFEGTVTAAEKSALFGVSLSGGGIRSATFNLGILQGLADLDLLRHVDYLSTVSGGGYIGGWLVAWIKRAGGIGGIHTIQTMLAPKHSPNPAGEDQAPIRFLRQYSNYLTPKSGFFTADTWTLVTEWFRNAFLNQLILVLFLASILLLPHGLVRFPIRTSILWPEILVVVSIAGFALAVLVIALNMSSFDSGGGGRSWLDNLRKRVVHPRWVQAAVVLPVLIAAFAFTMWHVPVILNQPTGHLSNNVLGPLAQWAGLSSLPHKWPTSWPFLGIAPAGTAGPRVADDARLVTLILFLSLLVVSFGGRFDRCFYDGRQGKTASRKGLAVVSILITAFIASWIGGALTVLFSHVWVPGVNSTTTPWTARLIPALVFGPPLLVIVFALTVAMQIGLLGRNLPDERREWWSRLGAWAMIYSLAWALICGISLYGPVLIGWGIKSGKEWLAAGGVTWMATTLFGVLSARSARTSATTSEVTGKRWWMNMVAVVAPYVFIIGLLLLISYALHAALHPGAESSIGAMVRDTDSPWRPWLAALGCIGVAGVLAWRFDVNEFSMHHFYKNRLVRCYLGASRIKERSANPFTGFDPKDEVKLATLRVKKDPEIKNDVCYVGPYPILNVALNLVGGMNLAWQERKAESFVFTPQFCGYAYSPPDRPPTPSDQQATNPADQQPANPLEPDATNPRSRCTVEGYRPTGRYAYSADGGIGLGTAMAISGAAASPNMGYHSSPAVTFLMTMFNARLGWWLGNPRRSKWNKSSPGIGLSYLLKELLGTTTDTSSFVNLSDGGHFENLGLYELVRRRCLYIIACDAAQDPGPAFAGLGNAIRKCRTDLGVEIDVPLDRMRALGEFGSARAHATVGTVRYPNGVVGALLYIKTSLTRDESVDLLEYSIREPEFPNQTTADQWFDESQFESYRKLGHHSISAILNTVEDRWARHAGLQALFEDLHALWFPPTPAITKFGRKHAEAYDQLMERVREAGLQDLDSVLFPGAHIAAQRNGNGSGVRQVLSRFFKRRSEPGIPRDEFYVVNSLIQLMETVFVDLNMDEERSHPHNDGWIRIFRRWAKSPRLQAVWEDSHQTYSSRFQRFCERTLEVKQPPSVEVSPEPSRRR